MNKKQGLESRLLTLEVVLEALLSLLVKKKIITQDQLQLEILGNSQPEPEPKTRADTPKD